MNDRPPLVLDRRELDDLVAALAEHARRTPLPPLEAFRGAGMERWSDLLFAGDALRDPAEASQRLLLALAAAHRGLLEHFNALPEAARRWYLEERLGIERLPPVPDRVVVVVEGDPKRLPATLEEGARLVAGKDAFGEERIYETTTPLSVLGSSLVGVHSWSATSEDSRIVRRGPTADDLVYPFHPFARGAEGDASLETDAPHELYLESDLLRFETGTLEVTVTFVGIPSAKVADARAVLGWLTWDVSSPTGLLGCSVVPKTSGPPAVTVTLDEGAGPMPDASPTGTFLKASLTPGLSAAQRQKAFAFSFTNVKLQATGKKVRPTAGYYNDGLLDLTKDFEPFGPVPRRGDAFYIRSDETFGKPLQEFTLNLDELTDEGLQPAQYMAWDVSQAQLIYDQAFLYFIGLAELEESELARPTFDAEERATPEIRWMCFDGTEWRTVGSTRDGLVGGTEAGFGALPPSEAFSRRTEIGGLPGHYLRLHLFRGDFGFTKYEKTAQDNAQAVASGSGAIEPNFFPDPPILSSVTLEYDTVTAEARIESHPLRLFVRNGLSSVQPRSLTGTAPLSPFALSPDGPTGLFYVGLADVPTGEVATLFFDVEEAAGCVPLDPGALPSWSYWTGSGWATLEVEDGTAGLRQAGIVRFAAPAAWAVGSSAVAEDAGRWLRVSTDHPDASGTVRALATDAVEAVYRLSSRSPQDPTPATPLPAEAVASLKRPVPGIKGVTNPVPSVGGRGPEPAEAFNARAGGVYRHRNRVINAWDAEELVRSAFPDLALLRCLPHHSHDSPRDPGAIGLVLIPKVPLDDPEPRARLPRPTVQTALDVRRFVAERATPRVRVSVLCPAYREVSVSAVVKLRRGVATGPAREALRRAVRGYLHPLSRERPTGLGEGVYLSDVARLLEARDEVDYVKSISFGPRDPGAEFVMPDDPCLGLIASAALLPVDVEPTL